MKVLLLADAKSSHTAKWVHGLTARGIAVSVFGISAQKSSDLSKVTYLSALKDVKKAILDFKPDIVHAHYATSYGMLGRKSGFHPLVVSCWGSDVMDFPKRSFFHRWILRRNLMKADKVLATSKTLVDAIRTIIKTNVEIIPFGVDTGVFKPLAGAAQKDLTIGTIKSLEKVYRIDLLIEAFSMVKPDFPGMKLLIVGEGTERRNLEELVKRLGLEKEVTFKGAVPHSEVPALHNALDIFVNVSDNESFGVSVLEAMACAKPVIVTDTGGLAEIVPDNSVGFKVPVNNVNALAEKLRLLLRDAALRKQTGANARGFVIRNYDWNSNISMMIDVYEKLLQKR